MSASARGVLNKVPEVTIWFWIIKILCTTVGESFADWISIDLGVGLINTAVLFTVVLAAVLTWQMRHRRYNPFPYWLTVVVLSVTGTLYTDILTDRYHVPLAVTTPVCAGLLAVVFGIWYVRERTLSIHSIVTTPREAFYWLAILVTFALGTAAGDWSLELTGWGPGISILLPAFLIAAIAVGWRLGANAVLSFWLAYVLTRPLGANMGDWLAVPHQLGGQDLGTAITSAIFLTAILATVVYLAIRRPDVEPRPIAIDAEPKRERLMLGYYTAIATAAVAVLAVANSRPHASFSAEEEALSAPVEQLSPHDATASFPTADITNFRAIVQDTLDRVQSGDHPGAARRMTDLETGWDDAQSRLEPMNNTAWHFLDSEIDAALSTVRASHPDAASERQALQPLLTTLAG
jgi:uncharacterized membrane-anchored protein